MAAYSLQDTTNAAKVGQGHAGTRPPLRPQTPPREGKRVSFNAKPSIAMISPQGKQQSIRHYRQQQQQQRAGAGWNMRPPPPSSMHAYPRLFVLPDEVGPASEESLLPREKDVTHSELPGGNTDSTADPALDGLWEPRQSDSESRRDSDREVQVLDGARVQPQALYRRTPQDLPAGGRSSTLAGVHSRAWKQAFSRDRRWPRPNGSAPSRGAAAFRFAEFEAELFDDEDTPSRLLPYGQQADAPSEPFEAAAAAASPRSRPTTPLQLAAVGKRARMPRARRASSQAKVRYRRSSPAATPPTPAVGMTHEEDELVRAMASVVIPCGRMLLGPLPPNVPACILVSDESSPVPGGRGDTQHSPAKRDA